MRFLKNKKNKIAVKMLLQGTVYSCRQTADLTFLQWPMFDFGINQQSCKWGKHWDDALRHSHALLNLIISIAVKALLVNSGAYLFIQFHKTKQQKTNQAKKIPNWNHNYADFIFQHMSTHCKEPPN